MTMTARIPRPGAVSSSRNAGDDPETTPISVIEESVFNGVLSYFEISEVVAGGAALGAFETVAFIGTAMTGVGALLLFTVAVGALLSPELRAQLSATKKLVGVAMSPVGVTVFTGAQAMGYSSEQSMKAAELGSAVFSGYSAARALRTGITTTREAVSLYGNVREVGGFIRGDGTRSEGARSDGGDRATGGANSLDGSAGGNGGDTDHSSDPSAGRDPFSGNVTVNGVPVGYQAPGLGELGNGGNADGDASGAGQGDGGSSVDRPGGGETGAPSGDDRPGPGEAGGHDGGGNED